VIEMRTECGLSNTNLNHQPCPNPLLPRPAPLTPCKAHTTRSPRAWSMDAAELEAVVDQISLPQAMTRPRRRADPSYLNEAHERLCARRAGPRAQPTDNHGGRCHCGSPRRCANTSASIPSSPTPISSPYEVLSGTRLEGRLRAERSACRVFLMHIRAVGLSRDSVAAEFPGAVGRIRAAGGAVCPRISPARYGLKKVPAAFVWRHRRRRFGLIKRPRRQKDLSRVRGRAHPNPLQKGIGDADLDPRH